MNILLIGSGAREHALAKALHRSAQQPRIYCCASTYNPGIQALTEDYWVGDICCPEEVLKAAMLWKIDLALIGPEAPLEKGLADTLTQHSIPTIGPKQCLAQIETSKGFARELLKKYNIPGSPKYRVFKNLDGAQHFLQHLGENGYVIKADGLMGGKGVKVAGEHLFSLAHAYQYCQELHAQECSFVIEEKLIGQEFSLLCFSDGLSCIPMPAVQDHKRARVNNKGPNTGGMGSYSDANHRLPFLTAKDLRTALRINQMTLKALATEFYQPYIGILYGGFMATRDGVRLIEFNARFGDPEALNVLAILNTDFVELCLAMTTGSLSQIEVEFAPLATVCKYAVPQGYPDSPLKNILVDISAVEDKSQLYFAAVNARKGKLYATGSRTAAVVGIAPTLAKAEAIAETAIQNIHGQLFHREDIGTASLIQAAVKQMRALRQKQNEAS